MSIAEIFGLDLKMPVNGEAMRNVLAGKRADGEVPASSNGRALEQKIVDGAGKRFRAAMGAPRQAAWWTPRTTGGRFMQQGRLSAC
jgi:hypothetical protein